MEGKSKCCWELFLLDNLQRFQIFAVDNCGNGSDDESAKKNFQFYNLSSQNLANHRFELTKKQINIFLATSSIENFSDQFRFILCIIMMMMTLMIMTN